MTVNKSITLGSST